MSGCLFITSEFLKTIFEVVKLFLGGFLALSVYASLGFKQIPSIEDHTKQNCDVNA